MAADVPEVGIPLSDSTLTTVSLTTYSSETEDREADLKFSLFRSKACNHCPTHPRGASPCFRNCLSSYGWRSGERMLLPGSRILELYGTYADMERWVWLNSPRDVVPARDRQSAVHESRGHKETLDIFKLKLARILVFISSRRTRQFWSRRCPIMLWATRWSALHGSCQRRPFLWFEEHAHVLPHLAMLDRVRGQKRRHAEVSKSWIDDRLVPRRTWDWLLRQRDILSAYRMTTRPPTSPRSTSSP